MASQVIYNGRVFARIPAGHQGTHDSLDELHPRRRADRRIGEDKAVHEVRPHPFAEKRSVGGIDLIIGEDIHPHAHALVLAHEVLENHRSRIHHLGEGIERPSRPIGGQGEAIGGTPLIEVGEQLLVIGAEHQNIRIVIPGNEPPVAHGAQKAAVGQVIGETVLKAHTVNLVHDI